MCRRERRCLIFRGFYPFSPFALGTLDLDKKFRKLGHGQGGEMS